jgi:hypothetical protein
MPNKAMESIFLLKMAGLMMDLGVKISIMEKESIHLVMQAFMKVIG